MTGLTFVGPGSKGDFQSNLILKFGTCKVRRMNQLGSTICIWIDPTEIVKERQKSN